MSTHKEYWCKKDEKAINYHYNDAMGEILPFVVAGFMVIGLIVYRIRLGRKDQRLPSPFQKANLKQGLVFGSAGSFHPPQRIQHIPQESSRYGASLR
jgi:hypothetical protein